MQQDEKSRLNAEVATGIKTVCHYDGKEVDQRGELVERLPIVLSGFPDGEDRLLEAPIVEDGTGIVSAQKVHDVLMANNAQESVVAVSTDTTAAMSGVNHGSVVELERLLGRPLLKPFCREHIADLSQKKSYKTIFGKTKAPANADFKVDSLLFLYFMLLTLLLS